MNEQYNPKIIEIWSEPGPPERFCLTPESVGKPSVTVFDNLGNDIISWGNQSVDEAMNSRNLEGLDPEIIVFIFSDELIEDEDDCVTIENAVREWAVEKLL